MFNTLRIYDKYTIDVAHSWYWSMSEKYQYSIKTLCQSIINMGKIKEIWLKYFEPDTEKHPKLC